MYIYLLEIYISIANCQSINTESILIKIITLIYILEIVSPFDLFCFQNDIKYWNANFIELIAVAKTTAKHENHFDGA